jgi:hypothetical protein
MLQINMPQSGGTRAPINGAFDGHAIGGPVNFAAAVVSTIPTHVTASPMPAEPDSIPCFG